MHYANSYIFYFLVNDRVGEKNAAAADPKTTRIIIIDRDEIWVKNVEPTESINGYEG